MAALRSFGASLAGLAERDLADVEALERTKSDGAK
jgi:hypothetical protein